MPRPDMQTGRVTQNGGSRSARFWVAARAPLAGTVPLQCSRGARLVRAGSPLDHLVGEQEERLRDFQAQRLVSLRWERNNGPDYTSQSPERGIVGALDATFAISPLMPGLRTGATPSAFSIRMNRSSISSWMRSVFSWRCATSSSALM